MLTEFGSISGVAAAPANALARVLGSDAALAPLLDAARTIIQMGMREKIQRVPIVSSDPALLQYLIARFSGLDEEQLVVLFLDRGHGLIAEESYFSGSAECVSIRPRTLFRRALALGSHAILLAHNHPSGAAIPSAEDAASTLQIAHDAKGLDIELIDHLVVGGNCVTSMKRAGLL